MGLTANLITGVESVVNLVMEHIFAGREQDQLTLALHSLIETEKVMEQTKSVNKLGSDQRLNKCEQNI